QHARRQENAHGLGHSMPRWMKLTPQPDGVPLRRPPPLFRAPNPLTAHAREATMPLPLEGLRVVSIEQYGAGPYGTQLLSDMGAEVLKIEDLAQEGDVSRYIPPYMDAEHCDSLFFQSFNRGKRSIALDLRRPEGQE